MIDQDPLIRLGIANSQALNMDADSLVNRYRQLHGGNYLTVLQLNVLQGMNVHKYQEHSALGNNHISAKAIAVCAEEMVKTYVI